MALPNNYSTSYDTLCDPQVNTSNTIENVHIILGCDPLQLYWFWDVHRCRLQSMSQNYHSVRCLTVSIVFVWELSFGEVSCSQCGPCLAVFNITKLLLTAPNVMFYTSQELRQEVPSSDCRSVSLWVCSHQPKSCFSENPMKFLKNLVCRRDVRVTPHVMFLFWNLYFS